MKATLRTIALASASGVVIAVSLSGIARAITDTVFRYDPPKTGYLMIPPSAFTPDVGTDTGWTKGSGTVVQGTTPGTDVCFSAPVYLPHGSKLGSLRVWYAKSDMGMLNYKLRSQDEAFDFGVGTIIASRTPPSTDFNISSVNNRITDVSVQTINNASHTYFFQACMDGGAQIWAVRITYTYTTAGS